MAREKIAVAAIIALGASLWIATVIREFVNRPPLVKGVEVKVLARQYSWHFHYPGPDQQFGLVAPEFIADDNPFGLNPTDEASADDIVSESLVLPCHAQVTLWLSSSDVIHALGGIDEFSPEDAIPGVDSQVVLKSPVEPRRGRLRCVQLCGAGHSRHHAAYEYLDQESYRNWLSTSARTSLP